jgi:uncharacterized protein YgbK (DUF1537 family)
LVAPGLLLQKDNSSHSAADELVSLVEVSLAANKPVVLQTSRDDADVQAVIEAGREARLSGPGLYECVSGNLAYLVQQIVSHTAVSVLAVFGGDTLLAIARACGWTGFCPHGEIMPGVVYAATQPVGETHIICKPGGFGHEDALWRIWERIQRQTNG